MGFTANVVDQAIILAAWGNEIRDRTVQNFATAAERTAQWPAPPAGAVSYRADAQVLEQFVGGVWGPIRMAPGWVTTFVPVWTGTLSNPAYGNSTIKFRYQLVGDVCEIYLVLVCGSTVNGGSGSLAFTLPFAGNADFTEQVVPCKLFSPQVAAHFAGVATIGAGNAVVTPYFPATPTATNVAPWAATDASGQPGFGIPKLAGFYSVASGVQLSIGPARYRTV